MNKVLIVLSGGQDSTTCLFNERQWKNEIHAVTFDYGQRHVAEIKSAIDVANMAGVVDHEIIEVPAILKGTSPLVSENKLEQYADMHSLPGGLEKTFVPMRNQLFLTLAANRAYVKGITRIVTGVCQEDFGGYPDCRRTFISALEAACNLGTFGNNEGSPGVLIIDTPLMHMTKAQSVEWALKIPDCYKALAYTHTGYDGKYPPTGKDHATLLRAKGFLEAGVPDPLVLRAWNDGLMDLPDTANYKEGVVDYWMSKYFSDGFYY